MLHPDPTDPRPLDDRTWLCREHPAGRYAGSAGAFAHLCQAHPVLRQVTARPATRAERRKAAR